MTYTPDVVILDEPDDWQAWYQALLSRPQVVVVMPGQSGKALTN